MIEIKNLNFIIKFILIFKKYIIIELKIIINFYNF